MSICRCNLQQAPARTAKKTCWSHGSNPGRCRIFPPTYAAIYLKQYLKIYWSTRCQLGTLPQYEVNILLETTTSNRTFVQWFSINQSSVDCVRSLSSRQALWLQSNWKQSPLRIDGKTLRAYFPKGYWYPLTCKNRKLRAGTLVNRHIAHNGTGHFIWIQCKKKMQPKSMTFSMLLVSRCFNQYWHQSHISLYMQLVHGNARFPQ